MRRVRTIVATLAILATVAASQAAAFVFGTVWDGCTQQPVPGELLRFQLRVGTRWVTMADNVSNANGAYCVCIPAGRYRVLHAGWGTVYTGVFYDGFGYLNRTIPCE